MIKNKLLFQRPEATFLGMLLLSTILIVVFWLCLFTEFVGEAIAVDNMVSELPQFHLPWAKLNVPTLEITSRAISKSTRKKIYEYASNYACTLMRHFSCETEIQIENGELTQDSKAILFLLESEMDVLQYRQRLNEIMGPWKSILCGQPVHPDVQNLLDDYVQNIIFDFEKFIFELQENQ